MTIVTNFRIETRDFTTNDDGSTLDGCVGGGVLGRAAFGSAGCRHVHGRRGGMEGGATRLVAPHGLDVDYPPPFCPSSPTTLNNRR